MPWTVKKDDRCPTDKPWAVVKDDDQELEGCHPTEDAARGQQAALYAAERSESAEEFAYMDYMGLRLRAFYPDDEEPAIGLRAEGDGPAVMFGHLAVWDTPARVDSAVEGRFIERVAPGAFKKTITDNRRAIQVIYDHGKDARFGRRPIAKMTDIHEDERGVYFEADVLDTDDNRDALLPGLRAGVFGVSYNFRPTRAPKVTYPTRATDYNPDRWPEVTVTELAMKEFGPTPFPIYADASVGLRSITDEYLLTQLSSDPERLRALLSSIGLAPPETAPAPATPSVDAAVASPPAERRFRSREEFLEWISRS